MNLTPVLTLLGVTVLLPCVPALSCRRATIETVRNASELPLEWKTGEKTCEVGEGCQDLVMLLENGPRINLVIIKDCVKAEDQEPRVTWLRTGPGLSIVSYTRVCRHSDFCNDVSSTEVLGDLPSPTVPGTLRCPLCLSKDGCEDTLEQVCPIGSTHCYNGVLRLRGAHITTNLRVQGCMPQPDCNLLNGTKAIGTLDVSENCGLQLGPQALDCNSVALDTVRNVSDLHLSWTTDWKTCEAGQGCQETLMLIQNGQEFHMVLTKGCTSDANRKPEITRHRTGPGISIITYVHVCRHGDFCNDLSTTRNLWTPHPDTVPGTLSCPHCLSTRGCEQASQQACPAGSSHCYNGVLRLRGGKPGHGEDWKVQGCMPQSGCNLFDGTKAIGPIDVNENCSPQSAEGLRKVSSLPLDWTTGWQTCKIGEGCQETVLLIINGPDVNLVLSKGCTADKDHKPRVTRHRTGPGLSIISYTHVCRHWDFCNDLSSTHPLWDHWAPPTAPHHDWNLLCPLCLSKDGCPQNVPEQVCPAGSTHCYHGVLSFRGRGLISDLKVQGCMSQPGCNLLNGTQIIGPIDVREDCGFQLGELHVGKQPCTAASMKKDTCGIPQTINRGYPCLPLPLTIIHCFPAPGTLLCPLCFSKDDCGNPPRQVCPAGSTHCYHGVLRLRGGKPGHGDPGGLNTVGLEGKIWVSGEER
uniref:CD177 antigen n=1 Tax=Cricetulus griseus TaxID=10029 RepID=A0A8C2MM73_CRIGR